LELVRLETGQCRLLLEYIGYSFYELDKPSALDVMERVGKEALVEAYQRAPRTQWRTLGTLREILADNPACQETGWDERRS
jgi:hypothetical protein